MPAFGSHYLLLTDADCPPDGERRWRFVLQPIGENHRVVAEDTEPDAEVDLRRLQLLAVVRGLEALDEPARVTLLSSSRYVRRGLLHDLAQWRESNWHWEHFGRQVPIRDLDLWQRVDRALAIHQVECCIWAAPPRGYPASSSMLRLTTAEMQEAEFASNRNSRMSQRLADLGHDFLSAFAESAGPALSRSA